MNFWGNATSVGLLFAAGIGLVGFALSPVAEMLIARLLPRVGAIPSLPIRMTTALVSGAGSAAFAFRFGSDYMLPAFVLLAVLGVQLARIDISLHLLPNPLILALLLTGIILFLAATFTGSQTVNLFRAMAGAAILFVIYLVLALLSPSAIGMGDVKLAAPMGLYLGYLGWSQLLYGALLGFVLNGIVTLLVVARNRGERSLEVAHGPSMLAAAAGVALLAS